MTKNSGLVALIATSFLYVVACRQALRMGYFSTLYGLFGDLPVCRLSTLRINYNSYLRTLYVRLEINHIERSSLLNITKEVNPSFWFAVLISHIGNLPNGWPCLKSPYKIIIMHCKPLVIDYVMYAFVLFFRHARGLHAIFILSIGPLPKNFSLKQVFRGHCGP